MLSPLKPSVPSASLLRFLRSQSEVSIGSACAQPRPRLHCQVQFATGSSRRSSSLVRPSQSQYALVSTGDSIIGTYSRPKATSPRPISEPLIISRNTSTTRRPLLRRLFDLKRNKNAEYKNARPGPALIDDTAEGMFNIGRGLAARASNELRIRCTEFDNNGNVTLVNGEFRKLELIAKVSLTHAMLPDNLWHPANSIGAVIVRSPSSRPPQDRLLYPATHPSPTERHSYQSATPASTDKVGPRSSVRRIWVNRLLHAIAVYL